MRSSFLTVLALTAMVNAAPSAAPLKSRGVNWVASTDIESMPQSVVDLTSEPVRTYHPYLNVKTGCVPFPVVSQDGSVGSGLKPTGTMDGDCSSSTGQVYARSGDTSDGHWAIMYAWYMPKNQNANLNPSAGHRHDWQHVIVYFATAEDAINVQYPAGVAYLTGQDGNTYTKLKVGNEEAPIFQDGTHVMVQYDRADVLEKLHVVSSTDTVGVQQPLVGWSAMSQDARDALNAADFGTGVVAPINDANFQSIIDSISDATFFA